MALLVTVEEITILASIRRKDPFARIDMTLVVILSASAIFSLLKLSER